MNKPIAIFGIVAVIVVGIFMGMRQRAAYPPPGPATAEAAPAAAEAAAPAAETAAVQISDVIVYNIQACIDDKATLVLEGDRISWQDLTGNGLHGEGCPPEMVNKTIVTANRNGEGGNWPDALDTPTVGALVGPIKIPLPAKDTAVAPTVQLLAMNAGVGGTGKVSLVERPSGPRYRVVLSFSDPAPNAHIYTVDLTLQYK